MYLCWRSSGDDFILASATGNLTPSQSPLKHIQYSTEVHSTVAFWTDAGPVCGRHLDLQEERLLRTCSVFGRAIQVSKHTSILPAPAPPPFSNNQQLFFDHTLSFPYQTFHYMRHQRRRPPRSILTLIPPNAMPCKTRCIPTPRSLFRVSHGLQSKRSKSALLPLPHACLELHIAR